MLSTGQQTGGRAGRGQDGGVRRAMSNFIQRRSVGERKCVCGKDGETAEEEQGRKGRETISRRKYPQGRSLNSEVVNERKSPRINEKVN